MIRRLMRTLFAVLVMVAFGCLPTLAIASPATASPPAVELVCVSPEAAHVELLETNMRSDITLDSESCCAGMTLAGGDSTSTRYKAPGHPLRE
jgi:hypothetical protein